MKALQIDGDWSPRQGYAPTPRETRDRRAGSADRIYANPRIVLVDLPVPEPAANEILMRVGGVGVCGSDTTFLHVGADGYSVYPGHARMPCVIGHEFAGEVVRVGSEVTMFKSGDLVTAETMNWCGECPACQLGMFNQCENLEEIGFTKDGGYAEYLVVQEKFCFDISSLIDVYGSKQRAMQVGALIEPLAVAYNGVFIRGGGFLPGTDIVIFGAGPIGLSVLTLAKASGAGKIIMFDKNPGRIELARSLGASVVLDIAAILSSGGSPAAEVRALTGGDGAGVIVEATEYQQDTMREMEQSLAVGGKIVQIGISGQRAAVHTGKLRDAAASYHGTIGSAGHGIWKNVINMIATRRIDPSRFMNPRIYQLSECLDAIRDAAKGVPGKNVVDPSL